MTPRADRARRSDLDDHRDDGGAPAGALVDELAERAAGVAARVSKSMAPSSAASCSDSRTAAFASSSSSSASGAYTQPRVTISGPVTSSPVVESTVTITTTTLPRRGCGGRAARRGRRRRRCRRRKVAGRHRAPFDVDLPSSLEREHVAVFADEHVVLGHARPPRPGARGGPCAVLTVHGHEPLGLHDVEEILSSSCDA